MTEHFGLRSFREPKTFGEGVSIARKPFGNVARRGSHHVAQPIGMLVVAPEFRRQQEQIDSQIQLVRELPGGDFSDVMESSHAAASSNRIAGTVFEKSGGIGETRHRCVAEFATRSRPERCKSCDVGDSGPLRKGSTLVLPSGLAFAGPHSMAHPQRHKEINYVGRETFLITATTRNHVRAFEDLDFGRKAIAQLFASATAQRIAIPVCVYMPDHAHVVTVGTTATSDVREFVYEWKKATGFAWSQRGSGRLWQPGFWDNHLRASSSITEFIKYCVLNPVRAGLVTDPAEHPLIASDRYTMAELVELATSGQLDDETMANQGGTLTDQGSTKSAALPEITS